MKKTMLLMEPLNAIKRRECAATLAVLREPSEHMVTAVPVRSGRPVYGYAASTTAFSAQRDHCMQSQRRNKGRG